MNILKIKMIFCAITVLMVVLFVGKGICNEQDRDCSPILKIQSDTEVDALMEVRDYAKAEKLAREKNLDPRIIATILAYAGKKDESFELFRNYITSMLLETKIEVAYQCINLLNNVSPNLGKEFFDLIVKENVISLSQVQLDCAEVMLLVRNRQIEEAKQKFSYALDSDYAGDDLAQTAMTLIANLAQDTANQEVISQYVAKLQKKFPNDLRFRLQAIGMLSQKEPAKALAQLNLLRDEHPEFYSEMKMFIHLLRAKTLENLGEMDRAKSEYESILGTDFDVLARGKIDEYETTERLERELQDKIAQADKPQHTVSTQSRRFWSILALNIAFLSVIVYMIYKQKQACHD